MHSGICKGVLKVGFWEAQKGLKRRRKKMHSGTGRRNSKTILGCTRHKIKTGLLSKQFGCCQILSILHKNVSGFGPGLDSHQGGSRYYLLIVHKGGGARSCSCSCREAQKGGAKGRRKARGAGPMVVFYSEANRPAA
jgi:hypothetical protein